MMFMLLGLSKKDELKEVGLFLEKSDFGVRLIVKIILVVHLRTQ